MCGRYTLRRPGLLRKHVYQSEFEEFTELKIVPRWNIAPSTPVPVVRLTVGGKRAIRLVRWGLVPHWTKGKPKTQPINARSETVATSGMFRQAFERRRCLVPADGFYEWQGAKPPKVPFFFHRADEEAFTFAGIWERWRPEPDADPLDTVCILTTAGNAVMRGVHDRMPVLLEPNDFERWLDPKVPGDAVADLLRPAPDGELDRYPVSTAVNSVKNDEESLVEPAPPQPTMKAGGGGPNSA